MRLQGLPSQLRPSCLPTEGPRSAADSLAPMDRDCAECSVFGTGPLASNCSTACAHANVTLAETPNLDDGWCKEKTLDNQLFFFLVENEAGGSVTLRVRPQQSKWARQPQPDMPGGASFLARWRRVYQRQGG